MDKLKIIIIGAGNRGRGYSERMKEQEECYEVVGVADPNEDRRNYIKRLHNIPEEHCVETWDEIFAMPKFADVVVIATMDRLHTEPAIKAMNAGYDVLIEKPTSVNPEECAEILRCAKKNNTKAMVCHTCHGMPFYRTMKRMITNGKLGDIISINCTECVGNVHQSHSYVRGNWSVEKDSSCMLLAKCCHEVDLIQWLMGKKCEKVQSFGSLTYFTKKNKPEGAPSRCTDGCKYADTCPYNCIKLYYDKKDNWWFRNTCTKLTSPTDEDVMKALKEGPYGRCVFDCDNDVVDHQVVNFEFDDKSTASLTMCAFTKGGGSRIHIMGTKGEIFGFYDKREFEYYDFETEKTEIIKPFEMEEFKGFEKDHHEGADTGTVKEFYKFIKGTSEDMEGNSVETATKNHLLVFAAEQSRHTGKIVDVEEFLRKFI